MNQMLFQNVNPALPAEPTPFPPLFAPFQPVQTFMPVIRPVVGLSPQEALIALLTTGSLAPAILGQGLTLFSVPGASQLAGQLRALGFFSGLGIPAATFLVPPQAPPVSAGTIPFPVPGAAVPPISPLFQGLTALGNLLFPGQVTTTTTPPPPPVSLPTPIPQH